MAVDFTREELQDLHARSSVVGIALVACDIAGYLTCVIFIAHARSWLPQVLFAAFASIFVSRLFVLGHDACHQSLTPNRLLNRWLGTVAFMPSLHQYSLWDLGHNRIHHRFTNRRGLDYVWEPLDPAEYAALPAWQRWRYRFYRTPVGHLAYYGIEIWWRKMFVPRPHEIGGYCRTYALDVIPVSLAAVLCPALIVALRLHWFGATWAGMAPALLLGWIVPIIGFNIAMSAVIYLHHTHPGVRWTTGGPPPEREQLTGAVHVVLPGFLERTMHHIMDHTAHHARPGIPSYHLADGQTVLEKRLGDVIVEPWTPRFHLDTLRRCKLFDLRRGCWVAFE